ncbi:YceI family protein [Peredibacter starrii]|uniref:YceI family protein n=1 Tax=Peredibacter starrii TaxID=28202 RepID=A0AAX4HUS1_9BACT|nr:YceI family protein [Peredibacter starrii]WPU67129.1 YceI family protein [Peredibacter starrii]
MKTLLAVALAFSATAYAQNKPMTQTYNVDSAATKIVYVGKKVTGQHTGNVTAKSGNLTFLGEQITGGEVVVDMNSLTSTDITDKDTNAKYLGHMKSADFFDTAKYPEAKLVIKNSKKTDKGLEVTGDLTMIGKTNPITFLVTDLKKTDAGVTGKSNVTINRTKWGLVYGSGSFIKGLGDKAINDEFTLAIDLSAKK